MKRTVEGIPSGDLECWCLLVDRKTFISIEKRKPGKFDVGRFAKAGSPYKYMIYPTQLIGESLSQKNEVWVISIDAKIK